MGFLSFLKYRKLKREDVIESIIKLEKEQEMIEDGIVEKEAEIKELLEKGKKEKSQDIKLLYAKKINFLKTQKERDAKRGMFLLYNIDQLNKLKTAIEDKTFYGDGSKDKINKLLQDPAGLSAYLNKALKTRIKTEENLTNADETFAAVDMQYDENEKIYGAGQNDDQLLAMFEETEAADSEADIQTIDNEGVAGLYKTKQKDIAEE